MFVSIDSDELMALEEDGAVESAIVVAHALGSLNEDVVIGSRRME